VVFEASVPGLTQATAKQRKFGEKAAVFAIQGPKVRQNRERNDGLGQISPLFLRFCTISWPKKAPRPIESLTRVLMKMVFSESPNEESYYDGQSCRRPQEAPDQD
jgi:hypothetical protein